MTRRTVRLVERRTRDLRLPRADAEFLLAHGSLVEVEPGFETGWYRLTPRGVVGWFDGPTCRFAVRPKLAWPNLRLLLGLGTPQSPSGESVEPDAELLAVLASEFVAQLREVARVGIVSGYADQDTENKYLRGKLRAAEQLRDAASRAFPDRFHVTESVFGPDVPWNRIPAAIADQLSRHPSLPTDLRREVADAARPFGEPANTTISDADFATALTEPRAAHYHGLLAVCRLLRDGLTCAKLAGGTPGGFIIDLGRAFEAFLTSHLVEAFAPHPAWAVVAQPRFPVGPSELQPDMLIRYRDNPRVVLDAKWKKPGPHPADLHQILAYAPLTGATRVGLVYPGKRFARRSFAVGTVQVSLYRFPVIGTADECRQAAARLSRIVRRYPR